MDKRLSALVAKNYVTITCEIEGQLNIRDIFYFGSGRNLVSRKFGIGIPFTNGAMKKVTVSCGSICDSHRSKVVLYPLKNGNKILIHPTSNSISPIKLISCRTK